MGSHSRGLGGPAGCPTWALSTLLFPAQNILEWKKKTKKKNAAIFVRKFRNSLLLMLQLSECRKKCAPKKSISGACLGRKGVWTYTGFWLVHFIVYVQHLQWLLWLWLLLLFWGGGGMFFYNNNNTFYLKAPFKADNLVQMRMNK